MGNVNAQEKRLRAAIEAINDQIAMIVPIGADIAAKAGAIVGPVGELQRVVDEVVRKTIQQLGSEERTARLLERSQSVVARGLRAELARTFRAKNLRGVLDLRDVGEASFVTIVGGFLESLKSAVATLLPPTEGRKKFRAATNIAGLHHLSISAGEELVLSVDDDNVKKLIAIRALIQIDDAQAAGAAS